jgi:hypothetical protein
MASEWSEWRPLPDPRENGILIAPFGAGCYQLRHRDGRLILFGTGENVAYRMSSLLPEPLGAGHRSNAAKRAYVFEHLADIEYCTCPFLTAAEARHCERELKAAKPYIYST